MEDADHIIEVNARPSRSIGLRRADFVTLLAAVGRRETTEDTDSLECTNQ